MDSGSPVLDPEDLSFGDELEVLPPDHPLMLKFQNALRDHLTKLNEKLKEEQRIKSQHLKEKREERERLGVKVYKLQEELVKRQQRLKEAQTLVDTCQIEGLEGKERLSELQERYEQLTEESAQAYKEEEIAREKLDKIRIAHIELKTNQLNIDSEAQIAQRALSKTEAQIQYNEQEKQRQDLYIEQLSRQVSDLSEQLDLCVSQLEAQRAQSELLKSASREAWAELEALRVEKRQLIGGWQASLRGLQKRDASLSSMNEQLRNEQNSTAAAILQINNLKSDHLTSMETGEALTIQINRHQVKEERVKEEIETNTQLNNQYQLEYADYAKLIKETEHQLRRTNVEVQDEERECAIVREEIQKLEEKKVATEDNIMDYINSSLLADSTASYIGKQAREIRDKNKQLEIDARAEELEVESRNLELLSLKDDIVAAKDSLKSLEEKLKKENGVLCEKEKVVQSNNRNIDKNQININKLETRYTQLVDKAGGLDKSPLEREIASLKKDLDSGNMDIEKLRNYWMRHQHQLVNLTNEQEKLDNEQSIYKQKMLVLEQRKARRESEMETEKQEIIDVERKIRDLQQSLEKGHTQLQIEKGRTEALQNNNYMAEQEFSKELKDLELHSLHIKRDIQEITAECSQLQNQLLTVEEEGLTWERKLQLAQEAKNIVSTEKADDGEIANIRAQIHKLKVDLSNKSREEEELSSQLEQCVTDRERCITKAEGKLRLASSHRVRVTNQRSTANLKSELARIQKDLYSTGKNLELLKSHEEKLEREVHSKQEAIELGQDEREALRQELHKLQLLKRKKLEDLVLRQELSRHLESDAVNQYTNLHREHTGLDSKLAKQREYSGILVDVANKLAQDFPKLSEDMSVVTYILTGEEE